ncbi:MAG: SBBP repeat-containing protein [Candidatus Hodarchaeota archaeon]
MRTINRNIFTVFFVACLILMTINWGLGNIDLLNTFQDKNSPNSSLFSPTKSPNLSTSYQEGNLNKKSNKFDPNTVLSGFFLENKGQFPKYIDYYCHFPNGAIGFGKSQVFYTINDQMFNLTFTGARSVTPRGEEFSESYTNYFYGMQSTPPVQHCRKIVYEELYDGITLVYRFTPHALKYDFIVEPYACIEKIQMTYTGLDEITIEPTKITLRVANTLLYDGELQAWYETTRQSVPLQFSGVTEENNRQLEAQSTATIYFTSTVPYDRTRRIIIDPILAYSTYLGGSSNEDVTELVLDATGNIIVAGTTSSIDFPTAQAFQGSSSGGSDAFIAKISGDGQTLLFATYLGGSDEEFLFSIDIDSADNIVITGSTASSDYPIQNAFQNSKKGVWDQFITKISPDGRSLIFSTFFGGSNDERGGGVAFDSAGNILVSGITSSSDFPILNAYQAVFAGVYDTFIAKFSTDGQTLLFASFFGGGDSDHAYNMLVDNQDNLIFVGYTRSYDFPTSPNAYQRFKFEGTDGILVKFDNTGQNLLFSTYLGGGGTDTIEDMAIDNNGNIFVIGTTTSNNFPTVDAFQWIRRGNSDAFISQFSSGDQSLEFSTYLGGAEDEFGSEIILDDNGDLLIIGTTASYNFPAVDPFQGGKHENKDAFITKIDHLNRSIIFSTYFGGADDDWGNSIITDSIGNIIFAVTTHSTDLTTINAVQADLKGYDDLFIGKFTFNPLNTKTTESSVPSFEFVLVPFGMLVLVLITRKKTKSCK